MKLKKNPKKRSLKKVLSHLEKLESLKLKVGYFEDQGIHAEANVPLAALMYWQEYGLGDYPARFLFTETSVHIAHYFKKKGNQFNAGIKHTIKNVGKSENSLNVIGKDFVTYMQELFGDTSVLGNNSPRTIAKKGRNEPLVETGQLKDSLTYRIDKEE